MSEWTGLCRNWIPDGQWGGRHCNRNATGGDGLCNVCRAARERGRRRRQQNEELVNEQRGMEDAAKQTLAVLPDEAQARLEWLTGSRGYNTERVSVNREWLLELWGAATAREVES